MSNSKASPSRRVHTVDTAAHNYLLLGAPLERAQGCFPSSYLPVSTAAYSPAICPSGYSAARQDTRTVSDSVTETTEVCCPTASAFSAQISQGVNTAYPYLTSLFCYSKITDSVVLTITSLSGGTTSVATVTSTWGAINAYGIIVRRNNQDRLASSTESSSTVTSRSSAGGETTSPPAAPITPKGLGTGASVGIGVGVGVVLLGLIVGGVTLLLRKRKRKNRAARDDLLVKQPAAVHPLGAELDDDAMVQEMDGAARGSIPTEMEGIARRDSALVELEGK